MNLFSNKRPTFFESLKFVKNISVSIQENLDEYGDIFKLKLPFYSIYAVANADALQQILIYDEKNYQKSRIYWAQLRAIVGDALGTYEGEDFLWMKKLQMKAFTKAQAGTYLVEAVESGKSHFQEWSLHPNPINVVHAFSELNVAVLLKVLFGREHGGLCDTIAHYIADGEETISWRSTFPWRPYTAWLNGRNFRSKKSLKFFDKLAGEAIDKNLKRPELNSLISLLLEESDFLKENGRINRKIIRNEMIIHLGAGTETAAVALGWVFYLLHKHPEAKQKMMEEIDAMIGNGPVNVEHAFQMPYTSMVLKEALRMYPPSHGIVRDAISNTKVFDIDVQKDDTFFISSYALHRNPRYWEAPEKFIPERFLKEPEAYTYVPFGAGKHTCIGRYLAQPMMLLSLAQFFKNYDFVMEANEPVIPLSLSTLKPNQPLLVKVSERKKEKLYKTA